MSRWTIGRRFRICNCRRTPAFGMAERLLRVVSGTLNTTPTFTKPSVGRRPERRISLSRGAVIFRGTLEQDEASATRYHDLGGDTWPRSMCSTSQQMDRTAWPR